MNNNTIASLKWNLTQLTTNATDDSNPVISGTSIVWYGTIDENYEVPFDIFYYNGLSTIQLTTNTTEDSYPVISGTSIVWNGEGGRDNGADLEIFYYNGSSTTQLTTNTTEDYSPGISGTSVVWNGDGGRDNGADSEIFYYNGLSTIQLTTNTTEDYNPGISGTSVVWNGDGGSDNGTDSEIFYYNGLSTIQLTTNTTEDYSPGISGTSVVWSGDGGSDKGIDSEIFKADIIIDDQDTVTSGDTFTLPASVANLILTGSNNINGTGNAGNNQITGNSGNNLLTGLEGNDTINGGLGVDSLTGGTGNDSYVVDTTTDIITEAASAGTDTVESSVPYSIASLTNVENITLTGTAAIGATGNSVNNTLTGNYANNTFSGAGGNDTINGGAGSDIIAGGTGNDIYVFAFGQSLATGRDRVSDFAIGADKIDLLTNSGGDVDTPVSLSRAADSTVSDLFVLASQVFADSDGVTGGNQPLGINSAALAVVTTGSAAGTYVIVNNGVAGFQSSEDIIVSITGYTGTLPALGAANPGNLFVQLVQLPQISVSDVTVIEGNTTTASFVVTLSDTSTQPVTVQYATQDGTATGGSDYKGLTSATVTFAPNETVKTVSVSLLDDKVNEALETFTLNLSNPTNATLAKTQGVATITDTLTSATTVSLPALVENLTLTGSDNINGTGNAGNNQIAGNSGNNLLTGLEGNDTINGGLGLDSLTGGTGNDSYVVDTTTDIITEAASAGTDTVESSVPYSIASLTNIENITLTGTAAIGATGNSVNNTLTGNSVNNTFSGAGGNDTINGGAGSDIITGGTGNDIYVFGFGQSLATGRDRVSDFVYGTDKIDLLTGSGGAVSTPTSLSRAADSTASDLFVLAGQVFTDSDGLTAGNQALGVNGAALAVITTGSAVGTYVIVNNGVAGFQSADDLIISITGYTGTLPALGTATPSTLFV